MKKKMWPIIYGFILTAFTAYVLLDTFVFERKMMENATKQNTSMFDGMSTNEINNEISGDNLLTENRGETSDNKTSTENKEDLSGNETSTENWGESSNDNKENTLVDGTTGDDVKSYTNENVSITLKEYYEKETHIYVADVYVSSSKYIKSAFAQDTYGKNVKEKTSVIAKNNNAIFAVNGDYYGAQERGYVIRNGVAYRYSSDGDDILCLYADGTMQIVDSDDTDPDRLVEEGVWQAWNFGPGLLDEAKILVGKKDEVAQAMASNPRTAVGMVAPCHYIFVTSDGRTEESAGLSLYELAEFMKKLGVKTAYNLDGGGSATMYFDGEVINKPTTHGEIKERRISDIVYIGK